MRLRPAGQDYGTHDHPVQLAPADDLFLYVLVVIDPPQQQMESHALAWHNQERFTVEILIRSFESLCHTAHIFTSGCFRGAGAARGRSQYIEDHDVADAAASVQSANDM
jgi:hypothetical protein